MRTAERERRPAELEPSERRSSRRRALVSAVAGPALIVASVLIALRGFAFQDLLSNRHPDILSFWLPRSCLMGRSLAAGHVPLWNPYEMAGTPFAADAQSGWLSLPWMGLSWLLGCGAGLRAYIVLQPILAGLGLFWFLRKEELGRVAATVGGLSFAMMIAASNVAISLPFAGTLAWTPFALVGASGFFRATTWRRVGWLALAAVAWGQVAAAHLSHGLVLCTALVVAYAIARSAHDVRVGRLAVVPAAALILAFVAFLPLANLALLIPHFALAERSSLRGGYAALGGTLTRAVGVDAAGRPLRVDGVWAGWPFAFASAPGAYAGGLVLLCVPASLRSRARRYLAGALLAVGAGAYVLMLNVLVGAGWFRTLALDLPFGDVYLHNPGRLRYVALLVVPALGALGLQSFLDRPPSRREAAWWLGGAILAFVVVPVVLGARPIRYLLFAIGVAATVPVLLALFRSRPWARLALVGVLSVELLSGAVWSSVYNGGVVFLGLEGHDPATSRIPDDANIPPQPLRYPKVPVGRYLTSGPIARTIASQRATGGRYLAWVPPAAYFNKGYLWTQQPTDWPALLLGRAVLFRIDDSLGYSPIQLPRYWSYIRATDDLPVFYNASVIQLPSMQDVWLLGVRYLIEANGVEPTLPGTDVPAVPGRQVAAERGYRLFEVNGWEPRVSVVPEWSVAPSGVRALDAVLSDGFDPGRLAVVEGTPAGTPSPGAAGGSATYTERWPEDVRVDVHANADSIVVVRNAWDRGWTATVDGEPAPLLRTDYFLQGVEVPAGDHVVRLTYRDPTIARGIAGSAAAWTALAVATLAAALRRRRRAPSVAAPDTASAS